MLPSGRIFASWSTRGNDRRAVVDTIQQLEQRVLFQLMLGAGPDQDAMARQVTAAVAEAQVDLPDPTKAAPPVRRKKAQRRGGPPRSAAAASRSRRSGRSGRSSTPHEVAEA
jgi:hypothetical protein